MRELYRDCPSNEWLQSLETLSQTALDNESKRINGDLERKIAEQLARQNPLA